MCCKLVYFRAYYVHGVIFLLQKNDKDMVHRLMLKVLHVTDECTGDRRNFLSMHCNHLFRLTSESQPLFCAPKYWRKGDKWVCMHCVYNKIGVSDPSSAQNHLVDAEGGDGVVVLVNDLDRLAHSRDLVGDGILLL